MIFIKKKMHFFLINFYIYISTDNWKLKVTFFYYTLKIDVLFCGSLMNSKSVSKMTHFVLRILGVTNDTPISFVLLLHDTLYIKNNTPIMTVRYFRAKPVVCLNISIFSVFKNFLNLLLKKLMTSFYVIIEYYVMKINPETFSRSNFNYS